MTVTEAEYLRLAESDPSAHWELIDGVPCKRPGMTSRHEDITSYLGIYLGGQLDRSQYRVRIANSRVRLNERNWFVPDVMVVSASVVAPQWDSQELERFTDPLPLVVQVWSPSTCARDRTVKLAEYQRRRHQEIWFIHPFDRALTVWRLQHDGSYTEAVFGGGIVPVGSLPGAVIDLDRLFD